ncbi:MAG: tetratricopeptide repeat protein, partial [Nannocystaceae bacterium]
ASYAMRYLGRTYGVAKLKAILKGYGAGKTTEELFSQHFGKDLATVSKDFDTWMVAQISAKVTGWHPKSKRGKNQASATPDPRDKLLAQAVTEARAKDYEAASRTLQKLIGARGDGYHARMMLGEVLLQGPSWKSAKQHFEKAHGFHTESIDPLSKLAQLAQRSGDVAGEIKVLTTAIEIDGMSFDPAARLVVLATLADAKAAQKKALTRAVAIAPLHPISLAGRALEAAGKKASRKRAEGLLKRAVEGVSGGQSPANAEALLMVALASEALGNREQAAALVAKINPKANLSKPAKDAVARLRGPK